MKFNNQQLIAISDISKDISQISLASITVPYILNSTKPTIALIGLLISIAFWVYSLVLLRTKEPYGF